MRYARISGKQIDNGPELKEPRLKSIKCDKQKTLDKVVQKAKRSHWQKTQEEILALQQENSKEFWKYVGNIGIGSERHSKVPWQVIMTDGSIIKDKRVVLDQWGTKYSELLNGLLTQSLIHLQTFETMILMLVHPHTL